MFKKDVFIQCSLLYGKSKERVNQTSTTFQKLNCRIYHFLVFVETKVL